MSCFIDFIDINLWEKYTLTNLVSVLCTCVFYIADYNPNLLSISNKITGRLR